MRLKYLRYNTSSLPNGGFNTQDFAAYRRCSYFTYTRTINSFNEFAERLLRQIIRRNYIIRQNFALTESLK